MSAVREGSTFAVTRHGALALNPAGGARRLWFLAGIESNFRTFLASAIDTGAAFGFDCRILDVSGMVSGWTHKRNDWQALGLADRVDRVDGMEAIGNRVSRGDLVLFLYLPDSKLRGIWRALERAGCLVGVATLGMLSSVSGTTRDGVAATIRRGLTRLVKPVPSFWIISGRECVSTYRHYFRSIGRTRLIHAHSLDCERVQRSVECEPARGANRIVFLDQGWLSKLPPSAVPGVRYPPVTQERYRDAVVRFLNLLHDEFGRDVVVAGHPKADPRHSVELYEPHEVSFEDTASLVRGASLVVLNSTTAVHYPVLFRVPVLLYTSAELTDSIMDKTFRALRKELARPSIDIDESEPVIRAALSSRSREILSMDGKYDEYEEKYIRAARGDPMPLWDTVFQALRGSGGDTVRPGMTG